MKRKPIYIGTGGLTTTTDDKSLAFNVAEELAGRGWILRSGGADGTEASYLAGANQGKGAKEIYVPWQGYFKAEHGKDGVTVCHVSDKHLDSLSIASQLYPEWKKMSNGMQMYMVQAVFMAAGAKLENAADLLICAYAGEVCPPGSTLGRIITATDYLDIPHVNLAAADGMEKLEEHIGRIEALCV